MMSRAMYPVLIATTLLIGVSTARATWSIIIVDTTTKEVAIGSATCLLSFDLRRGLPVVRPLVGAGAAQSRIDSTGLNRALIWDMLDAGVVPETILILLRAQDRLHERRQYGIVDTTGRAVTFSGLGNGRFANGLTGRIGTLVYAIQGNVITGQPVLDEAEMAVRNTPGGIPEKLMAGMEAARSMGGDGRCSCAPNNPTGCGSPPPAFTKSAHIGFMIVARRGDTDGGSCNSGGCARGEYYMNFNIIATSAGEPDPVFQLREQFDAWRAALVGLPDAIESVVTVDPPSLPNDGVSTAVMRIEIHDFQGAPLDVPMIEVMHDPFGSAGSAALGSVVSLGNGRFELELTAGACTGFDNIAVAVPMPSGTDLFLMPGGRLRVYDPAIDLNGDNTVDLADLNILLAAFGVNANGDLNGDGRTDLADLGIFLSLWQTC